MSTYTREQLAAAAKRCLAESTDQADLQTARSLSESLATDDAANIERADAWFNKPAPLLPEFMRRYGAGDVSA